MATTALPRRAAASTPRVLHLGPRSRRVALIGHVLGSVGWFGAATLVLFLVAIATATGDPMLARSLARAVETSVWLSVPLGFASAATGIVLGFGTKWGLIRHWWVVLKEFAVVPLIVTDLVVVAPIAGEAASGHSAGRLLDAAIAHCVVLAMATIVSVVKPFGKTPVGRRRLPSRA